MNAITELGRSAVVVAAVMCCSLFGCSRIAPVYAEEEVDEPVEDSAAPSFSGPYTHANLSVLLVHGPDEVEGEEFVTLQEAMDQDLVTVYETGNVGELAIENRSSEVSVFIQSGDIVKGGRQDRTLAYDVVVPPRSGKLPIKSFCVESGRWRQRGSEDAAVFSSNRQMLASRDLKLAAKEKGDQSAVWAEVAETQSKLSQQLGEDVRSARSESSLQLTLEDGDLSGMVGEYTAALAGITEGHDDVIGFAFAINGEVNSVDVYAARGIFSRMWPKLLEAAAVEAIAEYRGEEACADITEAAVESLMAQADGAADETTRQVAPALGMTTRDSGDAIVFETVDSERDDAVLHKSYIRKGGR